MLKGNRPSTAPAVKPRRVGSAQSTRPLGRFTKPLREIADAHGSNIASVLASIKGDIVALQHKRELLSSRVTGPSLAMQSLEQQLSGIGVVEGDSLQTSENRCHLLEMLLQLVKATSAEASQILNDDEDSDSAVDHKPPPRPGSAVPGISRISGFVDLVDSCLGIAERKKLWKQAASDNAISYSSVGTQQDSGPTQNTELDNALNEPAVSQLRSLISHQKQLQKRLSETIPAAAPQTRQQTPPKKSSTPTHTKAGDAAVAAVQAELAAAQGENTQLRQRVVQLEVDMRRMMEEGKQQQLHFDHDDDFVKAVSACAFEGLDPSILQKADTALPKVTVPTDADAVLAQKIGALVHDASVISGSPGKGEERRKKDSVVGASIEGALWSVLKRQNIAFQSLCKFAVDVDTELTQNKTEGSQQVKNLQRTVAALTQKSQLQSNNNLRSLTQRDSELNAAKKRIDELEEILRQLSKAPERPRLINVKGQHASAAEREEALRGELAHSAQCVRDLSDKLQSQKEALAQEEASCSVVTKEQHQLLHQLEMERNRNKKMLEEVAAKGEELQDARDLCHALRKEIREKTAMEADLQQRHWKLEVELHISQNVMSDLRIREEELSKRAADAQRCQMALREAVEKERNDSSLKFSRLEENLRLSKANERAAKENLKSERARMLGNEKEVERLQTLDTQMELLEQNFTNYAASKLAQRDAQEDEEKLLQSCVEALMRDPFELPCNDAAEDEVALYLEGLKTRAADLETDDRVRRRSTVAIGTHGAKEDASGKRQLVDILQERYNQVQIYAAEQRLRTIFLEKETQRTGSCYSDLKATHEHCLQDLSLSKVQCESLVQRNTELEMERTQLLRNRASAEVEIKNLKATLQRLKMHGEEQEKILIEVGTQLQNSRISHETHPKQGGTVAPLGFAVADFNS